MQKCHVFAQETYSYCWFSFLSVQYSTLGKYVLKQKQLIKYVSRNGSAEEAMPSHFFARILMFGSLRLCHNLPKKEKMKDKNILRPAAN